MKQFNLKNWSFSYSRPYIKLVLNPVLCNLQWSWSWYRLSTLSHVNRASEPDLNYHFEVAYTVRYDCLVIDFVHLIVFRFIHLSLVLRVSALFLCPRWWRRKSAETRGTKDKCMNRNTIKRTNLVYVNHLTLPCYLKMFVKNTSCRWPVWLEACWGFEWNSLFKWSVVIVWF